MTRHLITPSLYNSWHYYRNSDGQTKQDFLKVLLKVKEPSTETQQKGIDFEKQVYDLCYSDDKLEQDTPAHRIASIARGGMWQVPLWDDMIIDGKSYLIYCKADNVKRDWVYDIKRTSHYEIGKYFENIQHRIYMWAGKLPNSAYLIAEGDNLYREDYHATDDLEGDIRYRLTVMMDDIMADSEFREAFVNNWKARE